MITRIPFLPHEDMQAKYVFGAMSETYDWGLQTSDVLGVHGTLRGAGITVAVLDTGIPNHTDLKGNQLQGYNCTDDATGDDKQGHGTHCSGIIAAVENGVGVVGVAPDAKIVPIKVLGDDGHGAYEFIANGIKQAVAAGVKIISMSLGSSTEPPDWFHDVVKDAFNKGVIMIAAAGNDGAGVNYPAKYDEVIAVAAVDKDGHLTSFSSRGDKVDFGAAGVDIYSTYLNQSYACLSGTSQACPFIAGCCALLVSYERSQGRDIADGHAMLARLAQICDASGRIGSTTKSGDLGFGIPSFANWPGANTGAK